jgi:hypothetical protein
MESTLKAKKGLFSWEDLQKLFQVAANFGG